MVRDPGNRYTENASFVTFTEKQGVQLSPMGQMNHETPMTVMATVEPSNVLRDSRATLYPANRQHLEKYQYCSSSQIVLPTLSMCLCLSAALIFLAPRDSLDHVSPLYEDWNEVSRLAQYRITSSKFESFLARQRPVLQFQLF